jgi:hypothetical protein
LYEARYHSVMLVENRKSVNAKSRGDLRRPQRTPVPFGGNYGADLRILCAERQPVERDNCFSQMHSGTSGAYLESLFDHADADIAGLLPGL